MGRISTVQLVMILAVVVLLFGAPKLPQLARSVGKSLRILKDETQNMVDGDPDSKDDADNPDDDKGRNRKDSDS